MWSKARHLPEDILKNNRAFAWTCSAVLALGTIAGVAASAHGQKAVSTNSGGKQWLAAMDTDHDGTVSKEEFDTYMNAQFAKADADHDGTLDAQELEQLRKNLAIATQP
jgi:EF hand